ncbi:heavy-metal-associated domain-containing protein [Candidatus Daviesbacteria bacterium]|nr:heavy-metal-associated domain-containing protein [Candidatus Daviesbacteria bacterium]MBI4038564.1 heavy-metal-associated domain-containing protein [Candidatus Daviesbacteria bacterium]
MKTVKKKLKIEGMHCSSCALNIDFDLEDLDGIKFAKTSYATQITEVEFETDKVSDQLIVGTIKKSGYTAKPI